MGDGSVRVICGPTAAGKSALGMWLAERYGATIISADSRQIYRGFDVGTAKPSAAEQARVPHRGIDLVDPTERYSAAQWAEQARHWIAEAATPLVVGGTGFYIRALAAPLFSEPELDSARRQALAAELAGLSTSELRRWCERLDPPRAMLGRTQLLRALETVLLTGTPISVWHRRSARANGTALRYLVVDPGQLLARRIMERIDMMINQGWVNEVRALAAHVPADAPAWKATGYAAIRDMIEGRRPVPAAIERIIIDTRQYAKRQRTWFRHQLGAERVTRIDPLSPHAHQQAVAWWEEPAR